MLPLIGTVAITLGVLGELRKHAPTAWPAARPDWIAIVPLSATAQQRATAWQQSGLLHGGEAEALALAGELKPDWFLTDDSAARLVAEALKMEAHGSLGVVLWCAAQNLIQKHDAESLLANLEQSSLWLSPRVRAQARAALGNMFGY